MSKDNDTSRNRAIEEGKPMEPKSDKTKAVDKGKSMGNPMGQQAKAEGRDPREDKDHTDAKRTS